MLNKKKLIEYFENGIKPNTNLKIGRCNLVWFNENNPNYKVIKCADYSDHVTSMLKTLVAA